MKKRDLTKKVLCTVLAASVFGVCGNVSAANEYLGEITGEELTGQDVIVAGEFHGEERSLTVTGAYTIGKLEISGESTVNLKVAGNITNGIYMHEGDELSLIANNANIQGAVKITGGYAELTGGKIVSGGRYEIGQDKYLQEDIRVTDQSGLIANDVEITGDVMAEDLDSFVEINGGTVTEVPYYEVEGDHTEDRHIAVDSEGNFITDGYTEVHAEKGGKVTVTDAVLNTGVSAYGNDSVVTVNNSSISTKGSIFAGVGGKIYLNGNENTVYSLGGEDVFMAFSGSEDGERGDGLIEINGGTLKAENLRYLVGKDNTNPWLSELEKEGFSITEGGIVLKENGVIETKGDQIFEHGVDVSSDDAVLNSTSGAVTNDAISYEGGTLRLTDDKYSLGYVSSALENLKSHQSNSQTKIVMTGNLITGDTISIDDINNNEGDLSGAVLEGVTVSADSNFIVGTATTPEITEDINGVTNIEKSVENGFGVANLDFSANSTGMVITNVKNVTLGDSAGGQLITVEGNTSDDVKVVVGIDKDTNVDGVQDKAGSFTIGIGDETSNTKYTLTGSVTVNDGSALNVNGQTNVTGGVELKGGSVHVDNGSLKTDITANGNSTITGAAQVGTLTGASDSVINIGNADKAGNVTVTNAELKGATVFLDPIFKDGVEIEGASKMAVAGTDVDGNYVVGQNSVMSFGVANNEKAQETFAKTGLTWGEDAVTAGLYINGTLNVAGGSVVVDGSLEKAPAAPANGTFEAKANSVVMVDGQSIKENAAITGITDETKVTIDASSKLYIDGAKNNETYHVIDGVTDKSWADENIISNGNLYFISYTGNCSIFFNALSINHYNRICCCGKCTISRSSSRCFFQAAVNYNSAFS